MTFKQFIKNVKLTNVKYIIKGYYLKFIQREYAKYFGTQDVQTMIYRAAQCSGCVKNFTCLDCGCSTFEMIMSGKPCKNFKK